MVKQIPFVIIVFSFLLLLFTLAGVEGAKKSYGVYISNSVEKLFVFGDSYVDTGNFLNSGSYKPPSGIDFPGKPAGRFCDGRVLTDYVASFLKIESPTPYRLRNSSNLQYGINFAYGGTGISKTLVDGPNMTVQIDSFEGLIKQNVYTKLDLDSSVALVSAGGNDFTFAVRNGSILKLEAISESLVKQLSLNLKRLHGLGINTIAVGLLQPVGCLPVLNFIALRVECFDLLNVLVSKTYNKLLLQAIEEFQKETGKSVFITLDLYNSFLSVIATMKKRHAENSTLMNPLEPCCDGLGFGNSCGSVDKEGKKLYYVCEKPEQSFFWDSVHPSQNGWYEVFKILQSSLNQFI